MKDSKRTWLIFAGILGFLVVFSSAIVLLRRAEQADQLQRLYLEASCVYPYFRSSSESAEAVHKIGAYPGERAEKMLFTLARGPSQCVVSNVQPDAVYELRKRHDPNVAPFLARLMKPETVMDTRRAIAEALQDLPCDQTCTTEVLHYLDQIDKGELNSEDTGLPDSYASSELHQQVEETITAKQTEIYDLLYVALMRNSRHNQLGPHGCLPARHGRPRAFLD